MKRAQLRRRKKQKSWFRRGLLAILFTLGIGLGGYSVLWFYTQLLGPPILAVPSANTYTDTLGTPVATRYSEERRKWMALDDMSPYLPMAFLAIEDQEFYEHSGFDYTRIAGALLADVKARKKVQGASTITQQYARNLYLTNEKTWTRKLKEALYAYRIEDAYDKDTILEGYLNTVYFGHGAYGVESASQTYYGKSAGELTVEEAAQLAAIPKGPSLYSPFLHPERAAERKNVVLSEMHRIGKLPDTMYERSKTIPVSFLKDDEKEVAVAPYYMEEARKEAQAILKDKGMQLEMGGYTIETAFHPQYQQAAEQAITRWMPDSDLQVGFMSQDASGHFVTAQVGGRNFVESPYNRVTQAKRQPGSAIKPILYAAALAEGFHPLTFLEVKETEFSYDDGRKVYIPKNVNGEFADKPISMAQALAISDNIYAVKTLEKIGYDAFQQTVDALHLNTKVHNTPASALGTSEVSLLRLTNAYTTIRNNGQYQDAKYVKRIKDRDGKVVYDAMEDALKPKQAIPAAHAYEVSHMLTGVFDSVYNDYSPVTGSLISAKLKRQYAAKSGTTLSDQYFIGYSPLLTAAVWNGFDEGKQVDTAQATHVTKQIWADFMETVHSGKAQTSFEVPRGVTGVLVDIETGGLASDACPNQRYIYVTKTDVPTKSCTELRGKEFDEDVEKWPFNPFDWLTD
ncbi:PBP1A family penicillin-binding protein [Chryseomicrobium sp. FSL W7-1435]|uniref:transglycosylase domain-containing protein n=1 Tax=Chryseomicrobium sp. FSL W7-1435 TaxID=2921704 RepID=UPI00315AF78A